MSLMETISPTVERLRKSRILAPEYSQSVKRPAHRCVHKLEELHEAGRINDACFQSGNKLLHHYYGSLGHDVRLEDWSSGQESREFSTLHHAEVLKEARLHVNSKRRWKALLAIVEESKSLEDIGKEWMPYLKGEVRCRMAGLSLIATGLEDLSELWGFSQSYHSRPPSR